MLDLYLLRHPKTQANRDNVIQGQSSSPLLEGFKKKIERIAGELCEQGPIKHVYSSILPRARDPASYLVAILGTLQNQAVTYHRMPDLKERHWGVLQGKKYNEIETGGSTLTDYLFHLDNISEGENLKTIENRVERFYNSSIKDKIGKICIVGHRFHLTYLINFIEGNNILLDPPSDWSNLTIIHVPIINTQEPS